MRVVVKPQTAYAKVVKSVCKVLITRKKQNAIDLKKKIILTITIISFSSGWKYCWLGCISCNGSWWKENRRSIIFLFFCYFDEILKNYIIIPNNVNKKRFWEVWEMLLICLHMQLIYKYIFQFFETNNQLVKFYFLFFKTFHSYIDKMLLFDMFGVH